MATIPACAHTPLVVGETVEVHWKGEWFAALVLFVGEGEAKVHFLGWAREWDTIVPTERVRLEVEWQPLSPEGTLEPGARVQAFWQGSWYDAEVLACAAASVSVHYVGWDAEHDGPVPRDRVRCPRRAPLEAPDPRAKALGSAPTEPPVPGTVVEAAWREGWYQAVVLAARGDAVRIRYVGFGPDWDEDVPLERVRVGADLEVLETRPAPKAV